MVVVFFFFFPTVTAGSMMKYCAAVAHRKIPEERMAVSTVEGVPPWGCQLETDLQRLILMFLYIYVLHLETNQNKLEPFSNEACVINAGINGFTG